MPGSGAHHGPACAIRVRGSAPRNKPPCRWDFTRRDPNSARLSQDTEKNCRTSSAEPMVSPRACYGRGRSKRDVTSPVFRHAYIFRLVMSGVAIRLVKNLQSTSTYIKTTARHLAPGKSSRTLISQRPIEENRNRKSKLSFLSNCLRAYKSVFRRHSTCDANPPD